MITPLETQHTGNQDVELLQQNVKKFVKVLEDNPLLDGVLIEDVEFDGVNDLTFNHGLGRQPRGCHPVDIEMPAATTSAALGRSVWNNQTITMFASAACTVKLWVW